MSKRIKHKTLKNLAIIFTYFTVGDIYPRIPLEEKLKHRKTNIFKIF